MQIRKRVEETISIALRGTKDSWLITVKITKLEEKGDQIVASGTYGEGYSNPKVGNFVITLSKQDLSVLNYELK